MLQKAQITPHGMITSIFYFTGMCQYVYLSVRQDDWISFPFTDHTQHTCRCIFAEWTSVNKVFTYACIYISFFKDTFETTARVVTPAVRSWINILSWEIQVDHVQRELDAFFVFTTLLMHFCCCFTVLISVLQNINSMFAPKVVQDYFSF